MKGSSLLVLLVISAAFFQTNPLEIGFFRDKTFQNILKEVFIYKLQIREIVRMRNQERIPCSKVQRNLQNSVS
jgi:hypothetical protein